ncbi:MAG: hypothetical protein GY913_08070 [Proteobacteria bacterium]|nr:hypothetical protein [Pseudomonadota bacterium]MCP4916867.1 hypothetical protein [Pseudomonadota bacterium]
MGIDEANTWSAVPYASVTTKPRLKAQPGTSDAPEAARDNEIEGSWTIYLDIDEEGRVTSARMKETVGYGIDDWCKAQWIGKKHFRPGERDGTPVPVTNIPMKCAIKALD